MERVFSNPLLNENALCIYRQPGSVKGTLVRAGLWRGGSAGFAPADGPLVSHRFMRTRPPMGPLIGVSDEHLAEVPEGAPLRVAAVFVGQLADDDLIVDQPTRLLREVPALLGDVTVEVVVASSEGRWRSGVVVNGMEVASAAGHTHASVLKDLTQQLQVIRNESLLARRTKKSESHPDLAVSRVS